MVWVLITIFIILVVALAWVIGTYNGLVRARQNTMNAWSQIDVHLKRRYDLIPNLVETAKGYMKHESETLEKVIAARNQAIAADGVKEQAKAEGQLNSILGGFFAVSESYPELKANENMLALQEELSATENKLSFARQYYNDVVTDYNTRLETFPSSFIANLGSFKPKDHFELENPEEREPVKVKF